MTTKLYIEKCPDKLKWYADKVGQYVPYLGTTDNEYVSREPEGYINFVSMSDAIKVEEE